MNITLLVNNKGAISVSNQITPKNIIDIRSIRLPGIVSNSKPGGGTTDYIVEMLYNAKENQDYICFLNVGARLPEEYSKLFETSKSIEFKIIRNP